ncbi:MAG TPA: ABC transporter ATP-binding protein [Mycobacteriales bacterium]|nr:ABC transporter ATP-binding protein [Mycobacteriales bacterium]
MADGAPLLEVRDLRTLIPTSRGTVRAVDGVSFDVRLGEVLGLVGESGSGKSVTCRSIMGLMPPGAARISGEVYYRPPGASPAEAERNVLTLSREQRRRLWGAELSMVFQDPMTALNPVVRIGKQVIEAVASHSDLSRSDAEARAVELLDRVGIPSAKRRMDDYPHQFSGGMMQRALIAIALASNPRILFADEPTTSLDVVIQDQILDLLLELQRDLGMSVVLVSHDMSVISEICDRVLVMYAGQVVEATETDRLLGVPSHPYTVALLRSLPQFVTGTRFLPSIAGAPPDMTRVGDGCRFAPRCPLVEDACRTWNTELLAVPGAPVPHLSRCRRQEAVPSMGKVPVPQEVG